MSSYAVIVSGSDSLQCSATVIAILHFAGQGGSSEVYSNRRDVACYIVHKNKRAAHSKALGCQPACLQGCRVASGCSKDRPRSCRYSSQSVATTNRIFTNTSQLETPAHHVACMIRLPSSNLQQVSTTLITDPSGLQAHTLFVVALAQLTVLQVRRSYTICKQFVKRQPAYLAQIACCTCSFQMHIKLSLLVDMPLQFLARTADSACLPNSASLPGKPSFAPNPLVAGLPATFNFGTFPGKGGQSANPGSLCRGTSRDPLCHGVSV